MANYAGTGSVHSRFVRADDKRQLAASKSVLAPANRLDVQSSLVSCLMFSVSFRLMSMVSVAICSFCDPDTLRR